MELDDISFYFSLGTSPFFSFIRGLIRVRMNRRLMVTMCLYLVGLDGNTSAQERERLINRFNAPDNTDVLLFMLSTRSVIVLYEINSQSRVKVIESKRFLHS